jgi:acyl-CoA reductase-like NAD-dependent aldehyde dehydrogenase
MLQIVNPATEEVIATLNESSPEDIQRAFDAAKAARGAWASTPLEQRMACLARFQTLLREHTEEVAQTLSAEVGKPLSQARSEVKGTLGRLDFFLSHAPGVLDDEVVLDDGAMREVIRREPLGVVANISAWNYPIFVGSNVFVPALLTGNAVLYKPSEFATLTGLKLAELMWEAGVPRDVFQVLVGGGAVGSALVALPVDGIFFTGSHATGKRIAEAAAGRMLQLQLELGGKDPIYVCGDVDVEKVAPGVADGAFYNAGQGCCSVERIYVERPIYDAFVAAFVAEVKSWKQGDPTQEGTYLGPMTRKAQLGFLEAQVQDAVAKGARLLCGGKRVEGTGYYFEPTVLVDVDHTMSVMRDESFGPIIGIAPVDSDAEAIAKMNDTDYGLTAGVYTPDLGRAEPILGALNVGSAYWNCCDRVSPRLPWSGRQASGVGLTLSTHGIRAFTRPKALHLRRV